MLLLTNVIHAYLLMLCLFQVIAAAEKHLKCIHQSSLKQLEEQHAKDCANSYKNLEKKANEQLKSPRESGDREEINRYD